MLDEPGQPRLTRKIHDLNHETVVTSFKTDKKYIYIVA